MNSVTPPAAAPLTALPAAASLRAEALGAVARGEPLVVMVTLAGCALCDVVRGHYLGPMQQRGEVVAVQVDMLDRRTALRDVQGHPTNGYELARSWRVRLAPTVLFLDERGRELAERLEGMGVADFYGPYLEQRLAQARAQLRARRYSVWRLRNLLMG